jgi:hypothetical protein
MSRSLIENVEAARLAGMPLLAVTTADNARCVDNIFKGVHALDERKGNEPVDFGEQETNKFPVLLWDCVGGFRAMNERGREAAKTLVPQQAGPPIPGQAPPGPEGITSPVDALVVARKLPPETMLFMYNMHYFIESNDSQLRSLVLQGIWNLRDQFKRDTRTLIAVVPDLRLPPELTQDVVVFDESLPTRDQLKDIVASQHTNADAEQPSAETLEKSVDALQGLSAFSAESITAMSFVRNKKGKIIVDTDNLWDRKRKLISQTPGLGVHLGGETFKDIGGYDEFKTVMGKLIDGPRPPKLIVWIDEIEKMMAGSSGPVGDNTGTSQDQHQRMLNFMEEKKVRGFLFIGPPGSGKSLSAKAVGAQAEVLTLALNMGDMKQSLLGASEAAMRQALKVIESVSEEDAVFIATCNDEKALSPELKRRFNLGWYFFDIPGRDGRDKIWPIFLGKYNIPEDQLTDKIRNAPYTGAEIRNVCELAYSLGENLEQAVKRIIPVAISGKDRLQDLRNRADNNFLSAEVEGPYEKPGELSAEDEAYAEVVTGGKRKISVKESDPGNRTIQ